MSTKIETSASASRGRGLQKFYLLWMHVDGGGRGSDFYVFWCGRHRCMPPYDVSLLRYMK